MHSLINFWNFQFFKLDETSVTVGSFLLLIVLSTLVIYYFPKLAKIIFDRISPQLKASADTQDLLRNISLCVFISIAFIGIFHLVGISDWIFEQLHEVYKDVQSTVDLKLFKLGNTQLTLLTILYLLAFSWLLVRLTGKIHSLVVTRLLAKTKMHMELRLAVGSAIHYGLLFLGFIVLLQTAGIDLSALTVLLGALGIGISFGLQTITNNFISGLIIFFERPIKIGDRIQIGDIVGEVVNISLRATTLITDMDIAIVVPNSQFITSNVVNWTHTGNSVGLKIPISVSAKFDPKEVQSLLLGAVSSVKGILKSPAPSVLFEELTNDSIKFSIRVWTRDYLTSPETLRSELNFAISNKLKGSGMEIKFAPEKSKTLANISSSSVI